MVNPLSVRVFAPFMAGVLLAASPNGSGSLGDRITAAVSKQTKGMPAGAAVGVVRNGKLIYAKGFGMRDIAAHEPVDAQTRFEIGSVTKQFTAAAILQLKEQGKLALDDSLAKYLPSFPHARRSDRAPVAEPSLRYPGLLRRERLRVALRVDARQPCEGRRIRERRAPLQAGDTVRVQQHELLRSRQRDRDRLAPTV